MMVRSAAVTLLLLVSSVGLAQMESDVADDLFPELQPAAPRPQPEIAQPDASPGPPADAGAKPSDAEDFPVDNGWRYVWHDGRWWYYMPDGSWRYRLLGKWEEFDTETYAAKIRQSDLYRVMPRYEKARLEYPQGEDRPKPHGHPQRWPWMMPMLR